jgi:hypothetical protein
MSIVTNLIASTALGAVVFAGTGISPFTVADSFKASADAIEQATSGNPAGAEAAAKRAAAVWTNRTPMTRALEDALEWTQKKIETNPLTSR